MDLREYLFRQRLSVTEFGKIINYSRAHISKVVHGKQQPSKRLAEAIEKATHGEVKARDLIQKK